MLEVTLGPGILSRNYDGLQNDLDKMEGIFLKRGDYTDPVEPGEEMGLCKPIAKTGDEVRPATGLGEVDENDNRIKSWFLLK
jgi:V/A-type H+/Na+-transporting ATPase subunit A